MTDTATVQPSLFQGDDLLLRIEAILNDYDYEAVAQGLRYFAPPVIAPSAPARSTDPETSHAAAKREQDVGRFSNKSRQAKLLELFALRDMTDQQATIHLVGTSAVPSAFDGCRRRCSDLRAAGYLHDSGRRRKNAGSDDLSIVWSITAAGRAALQALDDSGWSRP